MTLTSTYLLQYFTQMYIHSILFKFFLEFLEQILDSNLENKKLDPDIDFITYDFRWAKNHIYCTAHIPYKTESQSENMHFYV